MAKQRAISKDDFIEFFRKNYCDIERAGPLPKVVGMLPSSERLISIQQLDELIKKAGKFGGKEFALFVEVKVGGNGRTLPLGKNRSHKVVYLNYDNWDFLYEVWQISLDKIREEM